MQHVVNYLLSGPAHLPYAVVSLYTLRQHWQGEIRVHAWPESHSLVRRICADGRTQATPIYRDPEYRGKNSQFLDKIRMMQSLEDCDAAMYCDADTIIQRSPEPLLRLVENGTFLATQFNDWMSNTGMIRKRVARLLGRASVDQEAVTLAMNNPYPSPNGGIFASHPSSNILKIWERWTADNLDLFIADETVLHAIVAGQLSAKTGALDVWVGGMWNCSPKFLPKNLTEDDIAVWHFHGDSNVRISKSQKGYDLWWPIYKRCLEENIGGIQEWINQIENKHLKRCEGWNIVESCV